MRKIIILTMLIVCANAFALNRYVDPKNGSDNNDGSADLPWQTISHAMINANPGDTVKLLSGYYQPVEIDETQLEPYTQDWKIPLEIDQQEYITIEPAENAQCQLIADMDLGKHTNQFIYKRFITIRGDQTTRSKAYFRFKNLDITGSFAAYNVIGTTIENCSFTGSDYNRQENDNSGILFVKSSQVTVKDTNVTQFCWGILLTTDCHNSMIHNCDVSFWGEQGIHLTACDNTTIQYCDIHSDIRRPPNNVTDISHLDAIYCYNGGKNITIRGNNCYNLSSGCPMSLLMKGGTFTNCLIENNMFQKSIQLWGVNDSIIRNNTFISSFNVRGENNTGLSLYNNIALYGGYYDSSAPLSQILSYHDHNIYLVRWFGPGLFEGEQNSFAFSNTTVPGKSIDAGSKDPDRYDFMKNYLFQNPDTTDGVLIIKSDIGPSYPRDAGIQKDSPILTDARQFLRKDGKIDIGAYEYNAADKNADDTTPPEFLTNQAYNITATTAEIKCTTNELANIAHDYGINSMEVTGQLTDTQLVEYTVKLTNLEPAKTYQYCFRAVDSADNQSISQIKTFTTAASAHITDTRIFKNKIELQFSDPLDPENAANLDNYTAIGSIQLLNVDLYYGQSVAVITTTDHAIAQQYSIITNNLTTQNALPVQNAQIDYSYPQGLKAYWNLDENQGTTANDTQNNITAELINGPLWDNSTIYTDGIDDSLRIPASVLSTDNATISFKVKVDQLTKEKAFIFGHTLPTWSNRIQIMIYQDQTLAIGMGDNTNLNPDIAKIQTSKWYHIALTYENNTYCFYLDGALLDQGTYSGLSQLHTFAEFGNTGNEKNTSEAFNGWFDDIKFFNRSLTEEEISDLTNQNNAPPVFDALTNQINVDEGTLVTFDVTAVDPESQQVTVSALNLPAGASFDGKTFFWIPSSADQGSYSVTFTASDSVSYASQTVNINVIDIPAVTNIEIVGPVFVKESSQAKYSCKAYYDNGTSIDVTQQTSWSENSLYTLFESPGMLTTNAVNADTKFDILASYQGRSDQIKATLTNQPGIVGIWISGPSVIEENTYAQYFCSVLYENGTYEDVTQSTLWAENSQYTWITSNGMVYASAVDSEKSLTVTAVYAGFTSSRRLTIANSIDSEQNLPPVFENTPDQVVREQKKLLFFVNAVDPDADPVSYAIQNPENLPEGAVFDPATAEFTWTPWYNQQGTYQLTFTASDGSLTDTLTVTIIVEDVEVPEWFDRMIQL